MKLEQKVTGYFEQWRDPVYRYVVAAFGNSAQAEDVTQEAFLQLYRCLHAGQSIGNARAWVFRVAHNLAVNQIKSQQFITPLAASSLSGQRTHTDLFDREDDSDSFEDLLPVCGAKPDRLLQTLGGRGVT